LHPKRRQLSARGRDFVTTINGGKFVIISFANLNVIVCNRLAQMLDVERIDRGLYQLRRPAAASASPPPPPPAESPPMANAATA